MDEEWHDKTGNLACHEVTMAGPRAQRHVTGQVLRGGHKQAMLCRP
jgi:hypothetical protein